MKDEGKEPVEEQDTNTLAEEVTTVETPLENNSPKEQPLREKVTALDLPETDYFNPVVWQQMKGMAETFKASGALGKDENASTLMVKLQAGREMDMLPVESIKAFYFVNGAINIYGSALVKQFRKHGWSIKYEEKANSCTATVSKGDESITDSFTFEEAEKSGWTKSKYGLKPGWIDGINRRIKLRYGVLSIIIKTQLPELLGSAVDIAEIAMDSTQVEGVKEVNLVPEADDDGQPATESQIATLKTMDKEEIYFAKGNLKEEMTKGMVKEALASLMQKGGKKS